MYIIHYPHYPETSKTTRLLANRSKLTFQAWKEVARADVCLHSAFGRVRIRRKETRERRENSPSIHAPWIGLFVLFLPWFLLPPRKMEPALHAVSFARRERQSVTLPRLGPTILIPTYRRIGLITNQRGRLPIAARHGAAQHITQTPEKDSTCTTRSRVITLT